MLICQAPRHPVWTHGPQSMKCMQLHIHVRQHGSMHHLQQGAPPDAVRTHALRMR